MNPYLYKTVEKWIPENSRVLDLGTGDGSFLGSLMHNTTVHGEGVEKNPDLVSQCIDKGIVAYQGDVLDGLDQYAANSFDYVLLLGTFQELLSPEEVLRHSFRVARYVIIGFTNFAYWQDRLKLMFHGTSPSISDKIPWYESPNIQFFSGIDFHNFCKAKKIKKIRSAYFNTKGNLSFFPNLRAEEILHLLEWEKGQ